MALSKARVSLVGSSFLKHLNEDIQYIIAFLLDHLY